jgi:hypothetical protein
MDIIQCRENSMYKEHMTVNSEGVVRAWCTWKERASTKTVELVMVQILENSEELGLHTESNRDLLKDLDHFSGNLECES